ncbi:MAG: hypothetical protein LBT13_01635 [Treponema sp.]|jgi:hypothetical protein|nr:hypothetical protein [Treponema sp.]
MTENKEFLPKENRRDRVNAIGFALRLFEINRPFNKAVASPEEFREAISKDAFAINAFTELEMDTSDRMLAVDIALRITETYNRNFSSPHSLTTDELDGLARSVLNFMRYEGKPIT